MLSAFQFPSSVFFVGLFIVLIRTHSLLSDSETGRDRRNFNLRSLRECLDYCSIHRPANFEGRFSINCSSNNFSDEEKAACESMCRYTNCWLCNQNDRRLESGIINCPANSTDVPDYPCRGYCDTYRPMNFDGPYALDCNANISKPEYCEFICQIQCRNICDVHTIEPPPFLIHCPAIVSNGTCRQRCDYQRHIRNDSFLGPFAFDCNNDTLFPTPWKTRFCEKDCEPSCSKYVCDRSVDYHHNYYNDHTYFYCHEVEAMPKRPPPPPPEPVYEGSNCEKRCDKGRSYEKKRKDGGDSYWLNCDYERYGYSEEEKKHCYEDCWSCPLDVCDLGLDMDRGPYPDYYDSDSNVARRKYYVNFRCPDSRPKPSERAKRGIYIAAWIIIALIAFVIIACIVSAVMYGRNRVGIGVEGGQLQAPLERVEEDEVVDKKPIFTSESSIQHIRGQKSAREMIVDSF